MSSPFSRLFKSGKTQEAALLPGNRFFVRRLVLDTDDVTSQVNLALEAVSPFPLEQMLVGHVIADDGKSALAYAAHRRRFTIEESFAWPEDCQVVPEFLALCGHRPAGAGVVVHRGEARLTALAWKAGETLPAAVAVAELADADEASLAQEAAARADLPAGFTTETLAGSLSGEVIEGNLILKAEQCETFTITQKNLDASDIRDGDFLAERRKKVQFNLLLWTGMRLGAAVLVLSLILEIVAAGISFRSRSLETLNEQRRPLVADIDDAKKISAKILELGVKRLLPLEMIALVNAQRPAAVEFIAASCDIKKAKDSTLAKPTLTIDARTPNTGDISEFLRAIKTIPEVESVTNSEPRVRETSTTFKLDIIFKQPALLKAAEAPKP